MAAPLAISTYLEHLDSKKNTLRKAILRLAVEWKDLDEHLDCTRNCFIECVSNLELERRDLEINRDSVVQSNLELESLRESLGLRLEEIESREESFRCFQKKQIEEHERKEKELGVIRMEIEGRMREEEMREVRVGMQLEKIEKEKVEFLQIQKLVGEKLIEIGSREGEVGNKSRELDLVRDWVERRAKELDLKEEKLEAIGKSNEEYRNELRLKEEKLNLFHNHMIERFQEQSQEIGVKEKQLKARSQYIELKKKELEEQLKEKQFEERINGFELKNKRFEEQFKDNALKRNQYEDKPKDYELKIKQIDEQRNDYAPKEKKCEEQSKVLDLKKKQVDEQCKHSMLKKKLFEEQHKAFELKKMQIEEKRKDHASKDSGLKNMQFEELFKSLELKGKPFKERCKDFGLKRKQLNDVANSYVKVQQVEFMPGDIRNFLTKDGKSLQIYLNEHFTDHKSMSREVHKILGLSPDPAKLVLDAMVGFYAPHLKNGDVEFETSVVRRSCNLLLGHVMILSPQIRPHVREEALRLAGEWKAKMEVFPEDPSALLALIQLFASYKLAFELNAEEIFGVMEFVLLHILVPESCRFLGVQENASDIIKKLIENNQHLVAVRYIVSCGLVNEFPLLPLLKDYLKISKKSSMTRGHLENNSCEAQDWKIDDGMASIRAVISCIVDYKVECGNWCSTLEEGIRRLQVWKDGKKTKPFNFNSLMSFITGPCQPKGDESVVDSTTPHLLASVFRNMNGKNLLLFLSKHVDEHELMGEEVFVALRISPDSGKLVLDAVRWFYTLALRRVHNDSEELVIKSCNFLLDVLMRLSPIINPEVINDARKLAVDWKANIVKRNTNPLVILGFLLFTGAYGLNSYFVLDELVKHYRTIAHLRQEPEVRYALSISEKIPACNALSSKESINQSTPKDQQLSNTVSLLWDPILSAPDPFALILDAMEGCYYTKLVNTTHRILENMRCFSLLLSQLLRAPVVVTAQVKKQAMDFVATWKFQLNREDPSHLWCFLLFLAAYELASSCTKEELLGFLEIVYNRKEAVDVFRSLGLEAEVPNFVRRLVERGLHLDALEYVYAFNITSTFPPLPFLKGYINYAKDLAKKIREEGHYSLKVEEAAAEVQDNALKAVKNFISLKNLELENMFQNLKAQVVKIEGQNINRSNIFSFPASIVQPQKEAISATPSCSLNGTAFVPLQQVQGDELHIIKAVADVGHTQPRVFASMPNASHKKRKGFSPDHLSNNQVQSLKRTSHRRAA